MHIKKYLDLCTANKSLGEEVQDFMHHVSGVKEESITDYLVWKWRHVDPRFKYINVTTFTRHEESEVTGADFQLELWIIGQSKCLPLLFQAKKFLKAHDAYVRKLNYPNNTRNQLKKLMDYSHNNSILPFYMIYTTQDERHNTGLHMIAGQTIEEFAERRHGSQLALKSLLAKSNPFHCMFCCPLSRTEWYFERYFGIQNLSKYVRPINAVPQYVRLVLNSQAESDNDTREFRKIAQQLPPARLVATYDLRNTQINQTVFSSSLGV